MKYVLTRKKSFAYQEQHSFFFLELNIWFLLKEQNLCWSLYNQNVPLRHSSSSEGYNFVFYPSSWYEKDFLQILEPWKRAMIFRAIGDLCAPPEANVNTDTQTHTHRLKGEKGRGEVDYDIIYVFL